MNISPVSFKGLITVKSRKDKDSPWIEKTYKTTKKEDGELLRAASENLRQIGYSFDVYGKDTVRFHNNLEKIVGEEIPQDNLGNTKSLIMGGHCVGDYYQNKYDSSYNKIFYKDTNGFNRGSSSSVVIDLMEPEERFDAAMDTLSNVQKQMKNIFATNSLDERLSKFSPEKTNLPKEKYAKLEEVLNKTSQYLDGVYGGPIHYDLPPVANDNQLYELLTEKLMTALGLKYEVNHNEKHNTPCLQEKDVAKVAMAICYLDSINKN